MRYLLESLLLLTVVRADMNWRGDAGWNVHNGIGIGMARHKDWSSPNAMKPGFVIAECALEAVSEVVHGKDKGSTHRNNKHRGIIAINNVMESDDSNKMGIDEVSRWSQELEVDSLLLTSIQVDSMGAKGKRSPELRPAITMKKGDSTHFIAAVEPMTTEELLTNVKNAKKGVTPVDTDLAKRSDFTVTWVSYNYDNVNRDLAKRWDDTFSHDGLILPQLSHMVDEFFQNRQGYKYCLNLIVANGGSIDPHRLDQTLGVAVHGEVYLNSYGAVDGQCNDYYSCINGGCSGVN